MSNRIESLIDNYGLKNCDITDPKVKFVENTRQIYAVDEYQPQEYV